MGTRGLMAFQVDGEIKGSYNHFDSYPAGLGNDLLNELKTMPREAFVELARAVIVLPAGTETLPPEIEERLNGVYHDRNVSSGSDAYAILRDTQGSIKNTLYAGVLVDAMEFARDSLFCEYGYVLNFDEWTLEFYRGFQRAPHTEGRFASDEPNSGGYYPIRLVGVISLDGDDPTDELMALNDELNEHEEAAYL